MSKYELYYFNEKGRKTVELSEFTEKDFIECQNSVGRLNRAMLAVEYFDIVNDNLLELNKEIVDSNLQRDKFFININRRMFNFLDTFYAYINFFEKNYKDVFLKVKKPVYDNFFEYRLIYNLRRYMTHCEIAITKASYDVLKDKQTILLDMDEIIEKGKKSLQKKFVDEIKNKKIKEIDLEKIITQFTYIFEKIQESIIELLLKDILLDLDNLKNVIVTKDNGGIIETYLRKSGKTEDEVATSYIYVNFQKKFMSRYEGKIFISTRRHNNNKLFYE